jgi:hypothetical protein
MMNLTRYYHGCSVTALIVFTFMLCGCGALVTHQVSQRPDVVKALEKKPDLAEDKFLVDMAKRYGLMALFAQTAYRKDLGVKDRDDKACDYLDAPEQDAEAEIRKNMPRISNANGGWMRYRPVSILPKNHPARSCVSADNGLFYETYVYVGSDGKKFTKAVIAFRGTENRRGQRFLDWKTNLAAAFGFEPAQYAHVRENLPFLIQALKDDSNRDPNADFKIYAVGHSLGGGLAQLASYVSSDIQEAFVFNASPVTGWTYAAYKSKQFKLKPYPQIHRITQGGEALELPRFFANLATNPRFGRHDIRIHFDDTDGENRGPHSMQLLACGFAELLLKNDVIDKEHDYPLQFIADNVLTSVRVQGMTPSLVWKKNQREGKRVCDEEKI